MDIYSILASKPHNPHYLNRYVTFIEKCKLNNLNYDGYMECHHVCPKADDMFPEYSCLAKHPWNLAKLTARQHYIAHLMLWKAFYNSISCKEALWFMSNGKWKHYSNRSRVYESVKLGLSKVWKERGVILGKNSLNNVPVYDPISQRVIRISKDHPRYTTGELKHHSSGNRVGRNSTGEIIYACVEDERFVNGEYYSLNKNMVPVRDSDGNLFQVSRYDVRYVSGDLQHNAKDTIWINDGIAEKTISKYSTVPEKWSLGRITNNAKGTIWIRHTITGKRKRINPCDIDNYQSQGYIKGH